MKQVHYEVVANGDDWVVRCEGKDLHRFPSLAEAEAAAFDMARTDRNWGKHADVQMPHEGPPGRA